MRGLLALLVMCAAAGALAEEDTSPGRTQDGTGAAAGAPEKPGKPKKAPPDVSRMPFTPDSIKIVVESHQDEIQACYEEMLAGMNKPVEGRLETGFIIGPDGLVKRAKVLKKGTTLKNPKLHECVASVLQTMEFPKPPDGLDHPIEYPFNLKAIK